MADSTADRLGRGRIVCVLRDRAELKQEDSPFIVSFSRDGDAMQSADLRRRFRVGMPVVFLNVYRSAFADRVGMVAPADQLVGGVARLTELRERSGVGRDVSVGRGVFFTVTRLLDYIDKGAPLDVRHVMRLGDKFEYKAVPQGSAGRSFKVIELSLVDRPTRAVRRGGSASSSASPPFDPLPLTDDGDGWAHDAIDDSADEAIEPSWMDAGKAARRAELDAPLATPADLCAMGRLRGRVDTAAQTDGADDSRVVVSNLVFDQMRQLVVCEKLQAFVNFKYPQLGQLLFPP